MKHTVIDHCLLGANGSEKQKWAFFCGLFLVSLSLMIPYRLNLDCSTKPLPVVGFGFLQLLILPGVPLFQLHLGLLLPLCLLLARVAVCGEE